MSELRIGDRVVVVEWAPELHSVPQAFCEWQRIGDRSEMAYAPAVGVLDLIDERIGRPAYWVRLEDEPDLTDVWALGRSFRVYGHRPRQRTVIVREVVSLEPIEVEP